jgi:hypothetical protein
MHFQGVFEEIGSHLGVREGDSAELLPKYKLSPGQSTATDQMIWVGGAHLKVRERNLLELREDLEGEECGVVCALPRVEVRVLVRLLRPARAENPALVARRRVHSTLHTTLGTCHPAHALGTVTPSA